MRRPLIREDSMNIQTIAQIIMFAVMMGILYIALTTDVF